jgi:membrane protein DedA with SNARE-associated domain
MGCGPGRNLHRCLMISRDLGRMLLPIPAHLGYSVLGLLVFGESAGLPLPGETALLTAGGLAAAGTLSLPVVILGAASAAIAGDTVGYWLGRRGGRAFLLRDGFLAEHRRHAVYRADRFFERYGTATVFCGRWVPGVRVIAAVMAGATRMPWKRFAVANALGAFAWAGTVASLAAVLGPTGSLILAATAFSLGAIALLVGGWRRWRASRRRATASVGPRSGRRAATPGSSPVTK